MSHFILSRRRRLGHIGTRSRSLRIARPIGLPRGALQVFRVPIFAGEFSAVPVQALGVVFLQIFNEFLTHQTAQVPSIARIARVHQSAELDSMLAGIGGWRAQTSPRQSGLDSLSLWRPPDSHTVGREL
jgi:hypothetical protein